MRVYCPQRVDLYAPRDTMREPGDPVPARELAEALRFSGPSALECVVDFLVSEFGWPPPAPLSGSRHPAALDRLIELVELGQVAAIGTRPSGSDAGAIPDEDDVRPLSELIAEEEEQVEAAVRVEAPMGIEPASEIAPPDGFEIEIEVADPDMPAFEFEVGS